MGYETAKLDNLKDEAVKHLDALWRTANWFGENSLNVASLVTNVYDETFRSLNDNDFELNSKVRMFRLLRNMLFEDIHESSSEYLSDSSGNAYELFSSYELSNITVVPREVVIRAIRDLPIEIRLAMILLLFERFSYQEIADVIGVHRKTVRLITFKGYALIRMNCLEYLAQTKLPVNMLKALNRSYRGAIDDEIRGARQA